MAARYNIAKSISKIVGWFVGVALMLLIGFHTWFMYHSEKTIEDLITKQSHGKLKATIKKLRIDYFNNKAEIKELAIFNTDTLRQGASYKFSTKELRFNILSKWDLVFHKLLLVDTVIFTSPDIVVTRRGMPIKDTSINKLLLVEELGNVYKTINTSLVVLNLQRFEITEGKIIIKDADTINKPPFRLSHIFFSINKLGIDSANISNNGKFLFTNRVFLRIAGQAIKLRDNKSTIAFSELMIDSKRRLIQITNPSIHIFPPEGQKNSFIASADKLNITGLDFNTLYKQPLIKIDSVYMDNPHGDLEVYSNKENKKPNGKKKILLDDALRHLPIAINVNHVVLQNGTGGMILHRAGKTTSFQTKNDNLNFFDIRINDTAANVVSIHGFNYTLRNYDGYTPDSIYRYRFDSLQFIDNKIVLFNFIATTTKNKQANLIRKYTVPRFEITDMDWLSFIFHDHFIANKAVLYNPVFNIEKSIPTKKALQTVKKKSIYQTLSVMDNLLDLNELRIINGEFTLKQGKDFNLQIQKLNWDVNANELTQAKTFKQLIHSIKELSFDTAVATNTALTLNISKSNFSNKDESLLFNNILLNTNNKNISANLNVVAVMDFSFNNNELDVKGIHWKDGIINISKQDKTADKLKPVKNLSFLLYNISANNTLLLFENDKIKAEVFFKTLTANSLGKSVDNSFFLNGLFVAGKNAKINLPNGQIRCSELVIKDEKKSILKHIVFEQKTDNDSVAVNIPLASFIPFVNKTMATNTIVIDSVDINEPQILMAGIKRIKRNISQSLPINLPNLNVRGMVINNASFHLSSINEADISFVDCKQFSLNLQNIFTQEDKSLLLNKIKVNSDSVSYIKNEHTFLMSNGNINAQLNQFIFYPSTQNWQMKLDKLLVDKVEYANLKYDSGLTYCLTKNISIQKAVATNVDLQQPLAWLVNKSTANIALNFIHFQTNNTNIKLNNFKLNGDEKHIDIDSISIDPRLNQENFISRLIYRKDYLLASSGKITLDGIGFNDGLFHAAHVASRNAKLSLYSDRLKLPGIERNHPLPISEFKKIPFNISLDTVELNNMSINYSELNGKTKQIGQVYFTNINGNILNIASKSKAATDSLRVNVKANFLNTIPLHLTLNESYMDSLNGFSLQLQVGPGNIKELNIFLEPLVSVSARSGFLDTMSMTALGNDKSAHGNMRLYYHGLKVDILDTAKIQNPRFKTRLLNFIANSFIRNNNDKRISNFSFVHNRKKSSVGYFLKMIIQGATGTIMPSVNKMILRKQIKKEAKQNLEKAIKK